MRLSAVLSSNHGSPFTSGSVPGTLVSSLHDDRSSSGRAVSSPAAHQSLGLRRVRFMDGLSLRADDRNEKITKAAPRRRRNRGDKNRVVAGGEKTSPIRHAGRAADKPRSRGR